MDLRDRAQRRIDRVTDRYLNQPESPLPDAAYAAGFKNGKPVTRTSKGIQRGVPITNGALGKGDRVLLKGDLIDAMPYIPSSSETETPAESDPIKALFYVIKTDPDDGISKKYFYIGGDRDTPKLIYKLPNFVAINQYGFSNTGKGLNDWEASVQTFTYNAEFGFDTYSIINLKTQAVIELPVFSNLNKPFLSDELQTQRSALQMQWAGLWQGRVSGSGNVRTTQSSSSGDGTTTSTTEGYLTDFFSGGGNYRFFSTSIDNVPFQERQVGTRTEFASRSTQVRTYYLTGDELEFELGVDFDVTDEDEKTFAFLNQIGGPGQFATFVEKRTTSNTSATILGLSKFDGGEGVQKKTDSISAFYQVVQIRTGPFDVDQQITDTRTGTTYGLNFAGKSSALYTEGGSNLNYIDAETDVQISSFTRGGSLLFWTLRGDKFREVLSLDPANAQFRLNDTRTKNAKVPVRETQLPGTNQKIVYGVCKSLKNSTALIVGMQYWR